MTEEKQEEVQEKKKDLIRCSKCNSTLNYIRRKTNDRVCRKCGYEEKLNKN